MVAMFGQGFDSPRLHQFANAGRLTGIVVSAIVGQATNNGGRSLTLICFKFIN
jgi:hypothetical protein